MIGITKLLCNSQNFGDSIRYVKGAAEEKFGVSPGRGPVVVWNCTKTCNSKCMHCYAESDNKQYEGELSLKEAENFIEDLGEFKVPIILFSGGEPLMRKDIFELIQYASSLGLIPVLGSNGTLITLNAAKKLKKAGTKSIGISLYSLNEKNMIDLEVIKCMERYSTRNEKL